MEIRRLKPDELQHHGVKGQRWGIRRYQNYDGTLIKTNGKKQTIKKLKEYRNMDYPNRYAVEKEVRDQVSKDKMSQYKKAFKKKDDEEFKLEEMHWDEYKKNYKEQSKKINEATKEYETIRNDIAKELIGKYSNKRMGWKKEFGQYTIKKGEERVGDILDNIAMNEMSEYYGHKDYYKTGGFEDTFNKEELSKIKK